MSNFFYYGDKDIVQGPFTELKVQRWYLNSYFSSDARFQITQSDKFDPEGRICTLGELIDLNGKINPFYFSVEKENREKKMEEDLAQLMEVVESLRTNSHRSEKDTIVVLQTQVAELVESNTDLRKRMDALSHQRETSPVTTQLDTKVTDLKNRVNEQEKNLGAMKKEISAVNSKCDRNENKLDKLIEKQKEAEGIGKGYDKRIADLKTSEESTRKRLVEFEASAGQIDSISAGVGALGEDMEGLRKELSTDRSKLTSINEGLDKVQNDLKDLVKNEKKLRSEIDSVKEETKKAAQVQHVVKDDDRLAMSAPPGMESAALPPWMVESKKAAVAVEAKVQGGLPWEGTGKEEKAPFETEKAAGDAGLKKEDDLPWNRTKEKKKESAPWESREEPPWSAESGKKKDTLVEAEKAGNGLSIEQKQGKSEEVAVKSEKAAADVKPVSRVKDWAAICRELSDEEEETSMASQLVPTLNLIAWSNAFAQDVTELLRVFAASLDSCNMLWMVEKSASFNYPHMRQFYSECSSVAPHFGRIREAIVRELRLLAEATIFCSPCLCSLVTPRVMLYHLTDQVHVEGTPQVMAMFGEKFVEMFEAVSDVLFHFIASKQEIERSLAKERELTARGKKLFRERPPRQERRRPTDAFATKLVMEIAKLAPTHYMNNLPVMAVERSQQRERTKDLTAAVKEHFACKKRKSKFAQEFEKHMAEGVPYCWICEACFESVDEYYQHMTTYDHARKDPSIFGICIWIWKGHEYWDANL